MPNLVLILSEFKLISYFLFALRLSEDHNFSGDSRENNYMKLNKDKCHLLVAGHRYETLWTKIRETRIWESKNEKLLWLTIDRNLNFDDHVFSLCKKAGRKLAALSRISNCMNFEKEKKNSFKSICGITVWVLPINRDVL